MNDEQAIKEFEEWQRKKHPTASRWPLTRYWLMKEAWFASRHVLFEKHPELVSFTVEPGCMEETEE